MEILARKSRANEVSFDVNDLEKEWKDFSSRYFEQWEAWFDGEMKEELPLDTIQTKVDIIHALEMSIEKE